MRKYRVIDISRPEEIGIVWAPDIDKARLYFRRENPQFDPSDLYFEPFDQF